MSASFLPCSNFHERHCLLVSFNVNVQLFQLRNQCNVQLKYSVHTYTHTYPSQQIKTLSQTTSRAKHLSSNSLPDLHLSALFPPSPCHCHPCLLHQRHLLPQLSGEWQNIFGPLYITSSLRPLTRIPTCWPNITDPFSGERREETIFASSSWLSSGKRWKIEDMCMAVFTLERDKGG